MRIDLVGPPGSGKTTLAPVLAAELDGRLVDMGSRRDISGQELGDLQRRFRIASSLVRQPGLTTGLLPLVRSRAAARGALGMPRRELAMSGVNADETVVVDEGPLQAIVWTLMMSKASLRNAARRLARRISEPDVILVVTAGDAVIANRVRSSGTRLLRTATQDEVLDAITRYRAATRALTSALSVPVVHVDCSADVDRDSLVGSIRGAVR